MKVILKDIWDLTTATFKKSAEDEIFTFGAAIAFYTIFSIAPLLILVISVGGAFISEAAILKQIQTFAGDFLDDSMIETINTTIAERTTGGAGIFTTIIAIGAIIFGATTVISQLKVALNRIWNVRDIKMNSVWNFIFNRLLSFGMILLFSVLLILSLIAEAVLGIIGRFFYDLLPEIQLDLFMVSSQIGTIAFAVLSFTLIFKILPDVHARWTDVLVGAAVTTVLFLLGKYLIGIYFSATGIAVAYRAAGSLIIFVIFVYYNVLIVLLGAVFTQVYTEKFGGKILPYKFATLDGLPTIERRE
ncbi:MAG: YihY/virulence factor BrkB family protein [Balneolaceae bacterium]|nr:MAG: YihY/virulence factor BrkB family protein [Balneolaceae bacterium]